MRLDEGGGDGSNGVVATRRCADGRDGSRLGEEPLLLRVGRLIRAPGGVAGELLLCTTV